ncbi:hypothetical protein C7M84_004342 [Penaeus vannamei]|uniref:Uncharacterized protein n=1 Tax=Penaeus vannamei TaxID=6689 RepID=A0A3R7N4H5_PENVA|nr:uncharacterized protein LOC113804920 [Penaeus vannamei]ROT77036.1 hypothetical protein C7M84_004342 [Penaeus vannamei]
MAARIHFIYGAVCSLAFVTLVLYRGGEPITASPARSGGQCRAMFEISKPPGETWNKDDAYEAYTNQLPPLVHRHHGDAEPVTLNSTRLQVLWGAVPYIPCKIREYSDAPFLACSAARAEAGRTTWVALVGDSQMRLKLHLLLHVLPRGLTYTFTMEGRQVSRETFEEAVLTHKVHPPTFEVIGRHNSPKVDPRDSLRNASLKSEDAGSPGGSGAYVVRVTLVWAPLGSKRGHPLDHGLALTTAVQEWAAATSIPDVIVVGYGLWFLLMKQHEGELVPFTELDRLSRPLLPPFTTLAARTKVLLWAQSRYRGFNFESQLDLQDTDPISAWKANLYRDQFAGSIPIVDDWLWNILRATGMWRWDTLLPFNLASLKECQYLHASNTSQGALYMSRWWNCADSFHTSYRTDRDEFQLLLNLLCNPFLVPESGYCCS